MNLNLTRLFNRTKTGAAVLTTVLGAGLLLSACNKHNSDYTPQEIAAVSVINASPKFPSLDFELDNQRVNYNALAYGGDRISYFSAVPGTRNGKVKTAGTSNTLYSSNVSLITGYYQTLFIVNTADSLSFLVVKDEISQVVEGKAKIRFGNLSSDSPAYALELQGDTTAFANRPFKSFTPFKDVKAARYKVILKNQATGVTVASQEDVSFEAGKFYTVWAKGLVNTTTDAQKLAIQVSKHI